MDVKASVVLFAVSAKMRIVHPPSSTQRGFVRIDHYSSKTGTWRLREIDADAYENALIEIHRIEAVMSDIPSIVERAPFSQLSRLRFLLNPCIQDNGVNKVMFRELQDEIDSIQASVAESEASRNVSSDNKELQKPFSQRLLVGNYG